MNMALVHNCPMLITTSESDEGSFSNRHRHVGMVKVGFLESWRSFGKIDPLAHL